MSGATDDTAKGSVVDDVIEEALTSASASCSALKDSRAVPYLVEALAAAQSRSTTRDVAALLASAPGAVGDSTVVDALSKAYDRARSDAVLGPDMLDALGLLAERSPLGAAAVSTVLLRLTSGDERFLLVRAAKVIGRLEALGVTTHARELLDRLTQSTDLAVEAEARQQLAVLALGEALQQSDLDGLRSGLSSARLALVKADLSEEQRCDARQLLAFVDLLLAYLDAGATRDPARIANLSAVLTQRARQLRTVVDNPLGRPWYGYASPMESAVEWRLHRIALGFERLAELLGTAEEWTNFDEALLEVAAAFELMVTAPIRVVSSAPAIERLLHAGVAAHRAKLGPLLHRVVGRTRLAKVIEKLESADGDEETVHCLQEFHAAACAAEHLPQIRPIALDRAVLTRLASDRPLVLPQLAEAVPGIRDALQDMGIDVATLNGASMTTAPPTPLPLDAPNCYANDPAVDDTVRRILAAAAGRLGPTFRRTAWNEFTSVVVSIVRLARDIRNDLPAFARSATEGGKGQTADEGDLQRYLFEHLRREFGRSAVYEAGPNSGGRTDSGVRFSNVEIPIEVKAEYQRVDSDHISASYLGQADQYASNRDGVSFLMVLDLWCWTFAPATPLATGRTAEEVSTR